ncbi:hypothetical protein GGI12_000304 [Dipsacomyces acuminosporus]|nr:hypothetical protein GGI12_000304 [Dipsacomyces acuminosporus]
MSASVVVPAEPRFSSHQSVYSIDPMSGVPTRAADGISRDDGARLVSVLVLVHGSEADAGSKARGLVWVWASVSPPGRARGAMANLALALPPLKTAARANASQLIGGSTIDDPTPDIARRLSTRFKRPIYLSLQNVTTSSFAAVSATSGGAMSSLAPSIMSQGDELAALERCLVMELKRALLPPDH